MTPLYFRRNLQEYHQIWCKIALSIIFGAGLGILFAVTVGEHYFTLMRSAVCRPVSFVGSAVSVMLPFLVSVFLIHSKPRLAYFIIGWCIASVTATGWVITHCFGSAAWLIRLLMQLPRFYTVSALIFLSVKQLSGSFRRDHIVYAAVIMAILGMMDVYILSPFLAEILDSYETLGRYAIHVGLDWRL